MESLSSNNKNVKYLLCAIDVFTKNLIVNQTNYGLIKEDNFTINLYEFLDNNDFLMYSTHNEGK